MSGLARVERRRRVAQQLELMGLEDFADAHPHELSGGMQQRVALARALVLEPDILLMDEPFGALDAQTRTFLQEEVARLVADLNLTVLFVTHSVDEAVYLADRVVVLTKRPGRIKQILDVPQGQQGPPEVRYRAHVAFSTAYDIMQKLQQVHNRRKAFIYVSNGYDLDPFARTRAKNYAQRYGQFRDQVDSSDGDGATKSRHSYLGLPGVGRSGWARLARTGSAPSTTSSPRSASRRATCEPMKPVAPVTRTFAKRSGKI
jgi:ABC-type proline/glycine betaine transport system ATPase subunit